MSHWIQYELTRTHMEQLHREAADLRLAARAAAQARPPARHRRPRERLLSRLWRVLGPRLRPVTAGERASDFLPPVRSYPVAFSGGHRSR